MLEGSIARACTLDTTAECEYAGARIGVAGTAVSTPTGRVLAGRRWKKPYTVAARIGNAPTAMNTPSGIIRSHNRVWIAGR